MVKNLSKEEAERFEKLREKQKEISAECSNLFAMERLCPFCDYRLMVLYQGEHGYLKIKCPNCGETVTFTPVKFRMA